jgi:hypothetical protein
MENLSMNKFQKSAMETAAQKAILGGDRPSTWTSTDGSSGKDTVNDCDCIIYDDGYTSCP